MQKNTEKFFNEIDKSSPVYHQLAADIQKRYLESWKNVINSSIAIQQEFADKTGMNTNISEETKTAIQNMIDRTAIAYQNQHKIIADSTEASKKIFDVFNENTKIFSSLNKNMIELMESTLKKHVDNQS